MAVAVLAGQANAAGGGMSAGLSDEDYAEAGQAIKDGIQDIAKDAKDAFSKVHF